MWFEKVFGFEETNTQAVQEQLKVHGDTITSLANGRQFQCGRLEIATMDDLRSRAEALQLAHGKLQVSEVIANVTDLHKDRSNKDALFQAASQFNLLEMINPHISPEEGVDVYSNDPTQGPACAIACGAGTVFRNYFVEVNGRLGQTEVNQIDCLDLIGRELDNETLDYWNYKNGYALFKHEGMTILYNKLSIMPAEQRMSLMQKLKVGIQWHTEVTLPGAGHTVTQVYCSALPVSYCNVEPDWFEPFARLILESLYASTLYAALLNFSKTGCNKVFLTMVGGGAFGNKNEWITASMLKVLQQCATFPLDVQIVSYGESHTAVQEMLLLYQSNNTQ